MTGKTIGESHPTRRAAFQAARSLGHAGEPADNGPYYRPRAYVVNADGDYLGCPVFLLRPSEQIFEEA
jgi:hypothetical protein